MVEHSVVINEEEAKQPSNTDYMHALESVKFDQNEVNGPAQISGECDLEDPFNEQDTKMTSKKIIENYFTDFTKDEERLIEKTLLQIRDRIRSGAPLSHQIVQSKSEER